MAFMVTVNAVDAFWNIVSDSPQVQITTTDTNDIEPAPQFLLPTGTINFLVDLVTAGTHTITANDIDGAGWFYAPDTSSPFQILPDTPMRLLIICPGETYAPGTASGKTGSPDDQVAGSMFPVKVYGVDANWNVNTNAITLTPEVALRFIKVGLAKLHISLDTSDRAVQNHLRGEHFAQILEGIYNVQLARDIIGVSYPVIHTNCVLTNRNLDLFPELFAFILEKHKQTADKNNHFYNDLFPHVIPVGGSDNDDAKKILSKVNGLKMLSATVGLRKAFSNATAEGLGIFEVKKDKKARQEMMALHNAIFGKSKTALRL